MKNIIYLVECASDPPLYKIGYTTDKSSMKTRLSAIQTGNPFKCEYIHFFETTHDRTVETILHRKFSHLLQNGEWYDLDRETIDNFSVICEAIESAQDVLRDNGNPYYGKFA